MIISDCFSVLIFFSTNYNIDEFCTRNKAISLTIYPYLSVFNPLDHALLFHLIHFSSNRTACHDLCESMRCSVIPLSV